MKNNERLQALKILTLLLQEQSHLSHLLNKNDATPLIKEICYGVSRYYFRLGSIAKYLVAKPPKDQTIWLILLMGLYQLHYLRIPDYAVVKETVDLLVTIKKPWAKGLINAVLRRFCREQELVISQLKNDAEFTYNHPQWLVKKIKKDWPEHWQQILQQNDMHPPMTLRINAQRTTVTDYIKKLRESGIAATPTEFSKQGILLEKAQNVDDLPGFTSGEVSVQDEAAQMAASLLQLKTQMTILDACCAPGGKTAHLLEIEKVHCVALDIEPARLQKVEDSLKRLHLKATVKKGDALKPTTWWDGILFDRILLDAPCSATGVIRRHPDIKLLRTEEEIANAIKIQHQLLTSLWPLLKPEGLLLYATCSIIKEENEQQIAKFRQKHKDCEPLEIKALWGHPTGNGRQILPGENNMDGFFYSLLKKSVRI